MTSYSEDELWGLLDDAEDLPFGADMIALVERVVAQVDTVDSPQLAFAARMAATRAYVLGGEPARSFVTFSWCLADLDRDPGGHDDTEVLELLWHFKWMVGGMTAFPDVPLDRTAAVLDDMERRYRLGGHSPHAVYSNRHGVAEHVGDRAAADHWYDLWCAAPRDDLSDCEGCDPTAKVDHLARRGRDEEALAVAAPVLDGRFHCTEQPQDMQTALLLPYLRTGRFDEARDAHRRAYQRLRPNLADLAGIARHVEFCALTNNDTRGLDLVERHLSWLDRAPSPWAAMEFASAAALVARRLVATGHGGRTIRLDDAEVEAAALADSLTERSVELAGLFDARNRGTHQGERIARRLHAEPIADVPLSATTRRPRPLPARPTVPAPAGPAGTRPAGDDLADTGPAGTRPAGDDLVGADPVRLLDLAEAHARDRDDAAAAEVLAVFDTRFAADTLDPWCTARRTLARGSALADRLDFAGAEKCWREAAEELGRLGDVVRRQVGLGMLGVLRCMTGRVDEGVPMVEESTRYLLAQAPADRHPPALLRLSTALAVGERLTEALAAAEAALALSHVDGTAGSGGRLHGEALVHRALCLNRLERYDEFEPAVTLAMDVNRPFRGRGYAAACALRAERLVQTERYAEAVGAYDEALTAADNAAMAADLRLRRGQARQRSGRPAEAIDDLVESVALAAEARTPRLGAQARFDLAVAYRDAGQLAEAAEAAEEAVTVLADLGAQDGSDRARYLLVQVYKELEQPDSALPLLDTLAHNLDGYDNLPARGQMQEEAGEVLFHLDRDDQAAARFAAAALAYHRAGLAGDEVRARRKVASALVWADRLADALAALVTADELAASLPPALAAEPTIAYECGMLGYEGTKILIVADRPEDALPRIVGVAAQFRSVNAFREALIAEWLYGDVLLRLDRATEAERVLHAVAAGLPRDDEALPQVAWLLSESLEAQGRGPEAAAVRAEYGLDEPSSPA